MRNALVGQLMRPSGRRKIERVGVAADFVSAIKTDYNAIIDELKTFSGVDRVGMFTPGLRRSRLERF